MARSDNQIRPHCKRCKLHRSARTVCMRGINTDVRCPLMIFTDYPDYVSDETGSPYSQDHGKFLKWMLARMSIPESAVALDFTLRCFAGNKILPSTKAGRAECIEACQKFRFRSIARVRPRVLVGLGQATLEAFTGKTKLGEHVEDDLRCWEGVVAEYSPTIFIGYSLSGLLGPNPGISPVVFRTVFAAAKRAGLSPEIDPSVPPFKWRIK